MNNIKDSFPVHRPKLVPGSSPRIGRNAEEDTSLNKLLKSRITEFHQTRKLEQEKIEEMTKKAVIHAEIYHIRPSKIAKSDNTPIMAEMFESSVHSFEDEDEVIE